MKSDSVLTNTVTKITLFRVLICSWGLCGQLTPLALPYMVFNKFLLGCNEVDDCWCLNLFNKLMVIKNVYAFFIR